MQPDPVEEREASGARPDWVPHTDSPLSAALQGVAFAEELGRSFQTVCQRFHVMILTEIV